MGEHLGKTRKGEHRDELLYRKLFSLCKRWRQVETADGVNRKKNKKNSPVVPHQASVTQPFMAASCRKVWRTVAEYAI